MKKTLASCLFFVLCLPVLTNAQIFLDVGVGGAKSLVTTPDGTWRQEAFHYDFDTVSLVYRAGIGYQFTKNWSLQANYVSLGSTKADLLATGRDQDYNLSTGQCIANCDTPSHLWVKDTIKGPELVLKYSWDYTVSPFISVGMGYMKQHVYTHYRSFGEDESRHHRALDFSGMMPFYRFGTGACYSYICGDVTYYSGVNGHYPIATDAIVSILSLKIPLY